MSNAKLDYLLDIIEVLVEYEKLDARVHDALCEASNLIYRATHDDELNHDNAKRDRTAKG